MTRTVDLVIIGASAAALAAVADAIGRRLRVLLVTRLRLGGLSFDVRQTLRRLRVASGRQLTVVTGANVVCVDGVRAVEAVVVRHVRTGRLTGFNASAVLNFESCGHRNPLTGDKD